MPPSSGSYRALLIAALCLPLLFTGVLIGLYVVDVPVQDDWSLVEDLDKAVAGTWGVADLLRSHNGHRLGVTRLILVGVALASDWRVDLPAYLGIAFAAGILLLAWRAFPPSEDRLSTFLAALFVGVLVASPTQWENWLWGLQMHEFLVVLLVMATLAGVSLGPLRPGSMAAAAGLALVATLTQGSALVLWPVGALVLALRGARSNSRTGYVLALSWAALGGLVVWAYLGHLPGDAGAGAASGWVFRHPIAGLRFVLSLVGHSLVAWDGAAYPPHDGGLAALVGGLAVGLAVLLAHRSRWGSAPAHSLLALAWILWSGGVSAQIALGRAQGGSPDALASRYVTLMLPLWIGLAVLLLLFASRRLRMILVGMCLLLVASAVSQVPIFPLRNRLFVPARRALLTGEDRALLGRLHPELFQVDAALPTLKRLRFSVFRPGEPAPVATSLPLALPRQRLAGEALPSVFTAGSRPRIAVTLANAGTEGWSKTGDGVGRGHVSLSSRWFDAGGGMVAEGPRQRLPRDLAPGESVALSLRLEVPRVPAGSYRLEVSALQEGVAWFPDANAFEVEVRP